MSFVLVEDKQLLSLMETKEKYRDMVQFFLKHPGTPDDVRTDFVEMARMGFEIDSQPEELLS